MQSTWRDAFSYAWGNFTGVFNEGSARALRWLFFTLFVLGSAWAVWSYIQMQELRQEQVFTANVTTSTVDADRKRLNQMVSDVKEASDRRSTSSVMAENMKTMGKYVFDPPRDVDVVVEPPTPSEPEVVVQPPQPEIIYEPPPGIIVKAIMVAGKTKIAVMDITGVGNGMMVRQGDTFLNRQGRIVSITDDKVVVRWKGKTWNVAPGF